MREEGAYRCASCGKTIRIKAPFFSTDSEIAKELEHDCKKEPCQ